MDVMSKQNYTIKMELTVELDTLSDRGLQGRAARNTTTNSTVPITTVVSAVYVSV